MEPDGNGTPLVAVAVVTSPRGILLGRRRDGSPPWTFPGGKAEPGETPALAAVRETAEETGLAVVTLGEIGRRVHPITLRTIVYVGAIPAGDSDARRGHELTEVRWASPEEADSLTGGAIFEPVRQYVRARSAACPAGALEPGRRVRHPAYLDNPKAIGARPNARWGYLPCGCENDGFGGHASYRR